MQKKGPKWINERTEIYVFRVPPQRSAKSTMIKRLPMHEKASIWECFFGFAVCRENTYISRLLAMKFIHKTQTIIFTTNFIIMKMKIVHFHRM